jgi:hypothetical protein
MSRLIEISSKFGRLTVAEKLPHSKWRCDCECGNSTVAYAGHLRNGSRVSCGCLIGKANKTHGMSHSPEYKAWDNARSRCYREKDRKYPLYGARGITMCDAWRFSFETFLADMGRRPSPAHSLDREDSDGPYAPKNCRWATAEEQNNNRRFNRYLMVNGERVTVAQAAKLTGLPHATILSRLDAGKSDMEAIRA